MKEIITQKDVVKMTGLSETTIDRYEKIGSFPKRLRLSPRRIGWFKEDIHKWIENLNVGIKAKGVEIYE